jgi:hypothetical protein
VGLIVVAAATAALSGGSLGTGTNQVESISSSVPFSGFGGYERAGVVHEIEAEWTVPSILDTATSGAEATWIGAQAITAPQEFIQIGTTGYVEPAIPSPGSSVATGSTAPRYEVFWTDTHYNYRPLKVFALAHPGDVISFAMAQDVDGWTLVARDASEGWSRTIHSRFGAGERFQLGEWIQEDPAASAAATVDLPYALTSPVTFTHLRIDDRVPMVDKKNELVLSSASSTFLVPTREEGDSFSLVPPSPQQRQYLIQAQIHNNAIYHLAAEISSERGTANARQVREVGAFAGSLDRMIAQLSIQTWSAPVQPAVSRFTNSFRRQSSELVAWEHSTHTLAALNSILEDRRFVLAAQQLRSLLGLPPV